MPWITLTRIKHIRKAGVSVTYRPGDSVEVGRQTAVEWILDGSAIDPFGMVGPPVVLEASDDRFGIRVRAKEGEISLDSLGEVADRVQISYGLPAVPCEYTFIWNPTLLVSPKFLNYGFLRVSADNVPAESWEMAAGLLSLDKFANAIGSETEQAKTLRVIGDLRLPVYESRLLWVRKCPATVGVVEAWAKELEGGADEYHSFLRALYTKRAMICTLPQDRTR